MSNLNTLNITDKEGREYTFSNKTLEDDIKNLQEEITLKQDSLIMGENITITNNVISSTGITSVNNKTGNSIFITPDDLGLNNVDNTSDLDKPISNAASTALESKVSKTDLAMVATSGNYNDLINQPDIPSTAGFVTSSQLNTVMQTKQNVLTAGNNITIVDNVISSTSSTSNSEVTSVNNQTGDVVLTSEDIGLGDVDNTSDLNKPISTATKSALDNKVNVTDVSLVAISGEYDDLLNPPVIPDITGLATKEELLDKQDTLVAGTNITIDPTTNTISSTSEITADIPIATRTVLGGIKQGKNIEVLSDGTMNIGTFTNDNNIPFKLSISNDGTLHTTKLPIDMSTLPSDFPRFTVTGESQYNANFYVTPHNNNYDKSYIFVINSKGQLLWYKETGGYCNAFRRVTNSRGLNRYCYLEAISDMYPTEGNVGFYDNSELVVLDENFIEIDRVRCKEAGSIPHNFPVENHDFIYIDDAHYIVMAYFRVDGSNLYENAIQEIKNGKVRWHWETLDAPELQPLSHTTSTGDYAHVNSIMIDYDDNLLVSFRNIGLLKLNRSTKEIMWVIGRNRNDFTGLESSQIPFQQHDIQLVKKDGSFTIFDNYGHTSKSRICRYTLNEVDMSAIYREYITTKSRSNYMGSAQLIDDTREIFDIAYGSGWNFGFEEYDFLNGTQLMQLIFADSSDLYRVFRDVDDLHATLRTEPTEPPVDVVDKTELNTTIARALQLQETNYTQASWNNLTTVLTNSQFVYNSPDSTQEQVDQAVVNLNNAIDALVIVATLPVPTYELHDLVLDGTNHVDTGIKLFDVDKDYTIILKYRIDIKSYTENTDGQIVLLHALYEESPWNGFALQSGTFTPPAYNNVRLSTEMRLTSPMSPPFALTSMNSTDQFGTYILVLARSSSDNISSVTLYNSNGVQLQTGTQNSTYLDSGEYRNIPIIVGAANMLTDGIKRHTVGDMFDFMYYDTLLTSEDRTNIVLSLI